MRIVRNTKPQRKKAKRKPRKRWMDDMKIMRITNRMKKSGINFWRKLIPTYYYKFMKED